MRIARLVFCAVALLTACDGSNSQAPPLDPPTTSSPTEGGGACGQTLVGGATALRFESEGDCLESDVMVLFRCSPTAVPVLRISSARGPALFLGGPFAARVTTLPANVRFAGSSGSTDVLIADPQPPSPSPPASPEPTSPASASPSSGSVAPTEPQPLVYVRQGGVTERWLRVGGRRSIHEPPIAWLIGDSILDGGREPVEEGLAGWQLTMDAEIGRSSSSGVSLAEEAAAHGADVVLVELGTNDASTDEFRATLRQTLDLLRAVPLVIWQTARGPVDDVSIPGVNAAIRDLVPTYPNTAIADWETFVPADALGEDGIHPSEGFEHLESDLLLPMLTRWRAAITRVGSTACGRDVVRETS